MTNIASVFKTEIIRIARKEIRSETLSVKKAMAAYRTEIAELKRRAQALEQQVRRLSKQADQAKPAQEPQEAPSSQRFSAKGLASQRKRLGLSAIECGLLLSCSPQSIYNWEAETTRPRPEHMAAIAALRTLGRRTAQVALASVRTKGQPKLSSPGRA